MSQIITLANGRRYMVKDNPHGTYVSVMEPDEDMSEDAVKHLIAALKEIGIHAYNGTDYVPEGRMPDGVGAYVIISMKRLTNSQLNKIGSEDWPEVASE